MAIENNSDLLLAYDAKELIISHQLYSSDADIKEHAGQIVTIEILRELRLSGITVREYNDMAGETWDVFWASIRTASITRANLNLSARVGLLSVDELNQATNLGGNFFEHDYIFILAGTNDANKITFGYDRV